MTPYILLVLLVVVGIFLFFRTKKAAEQEKPSFHQPNQKVSPETESSLEDAQFSAQAELPEPEPEPEP
ncbi:hypothetical protein HR45_17805, partial [Shewanella mangrovi]